MLDGQGVPQGEPRGSPSLATSERALLEASPSGLPVHLAKLLPAD